MQLFPTRSNLVVAFHTVPSAEWFAMALRTVARVYRLVSAGDVEEYLGGGREMRGCAWVTFDDGDYTLYDHAYPVLRAMGVQGTVFVSPRVITTRANYWFQDAHVVRANGGDGALRARACARLGIAPEETTRYGTGALIKLLRVREILEVVEEARRDCGVTDDRRFNVTADQLREMHRSGFVMAGGHTLNHPILGNESDDDAAREIRGSVEGVAEILDAEVRTFAYPNGQRGLDFGAREQKLVRDSGVRVAVSTEQGSFNRRAHALELPRLNLNGSPRENAGWIMAKMAAVAMLGINPEPPEPKQRKELIRAGIGRASRAPQPAV